MKVQILLAALFLTGASATYAFAHPTAQDNASDDANERAAADHPCPPANATAIEHANDHSRLFRCEAREGNEGRGHGPHDNETNETAENKTSEGAEHASPCAHAGEGRGAENETSENATGENETKETGCDAGFGHGDGGHGSAHAEGAGDRRGHGDDGDG